MAKLVWERGYQVSYVWVNGPRCIIDGMHMFYGYWQEVTLSIWTCKKVGD